MIVFVLRHADRKSESEDALSDEGVKRAKLLAGILAELRISVALRSEKIRARDTLQPLKDRLQAKLEVKTVDLDETAPKPHVKQIIKAVKEELSAGATAAVIGHTSTVGPIIKGLTGTTIEDIEAQEFDKLFVLSITGPGTGTVTMLRYGAPTPPPT